MALQPIFVRPLGLGTISTGNAATATPATHLAQTKHIGMVWGSSGNSNLWVRGDMGSAAAIDFVSLLSCNAQSGTTIRVRLGDTQAEVDGTAPYDSTALPLISPAVTRESGLYHSHLELPSLQTRRWWRIDIGSHTGDFSAATLVLGKRITFTHFYDRGFERGTEDLGSIEIGRWGVPDITDGVIMRKLRFSLPWMTEAEYEDHVAPMVEAVGARTPIYCCFDPEATTRRQAKTYFGWLKEPPFATGSAIPGKFSIDFEISSQI